MRWQGVWILSKIPSSSCFLLTGQMERQVASMADALFSPHLLMAAACREEATMEGWTWHTGTRTLVCVCVQGFVSMGVPKSVDASVGLWINHHVCVSVLVSEGAGGVCPLCTPAAATRPATCSRIREHADYTRHNGNTQTQICPQPTKNTHTHMHTHGIAANRLQQLQPFPSFGKGWPTWQMMFVMTDAVGRRVQSSVLFLDSVFPRTCVCVWRVVFVVGALLAPTTESVVLLFNSRKHGDVSRPSSERRRY